MAAMASHPYRDPHTDWITLLGYENAPGSARPRAALRA